MSEIKKTVPNRSIRIQKSDILCLFIVLFVFQKLLEGISSIFSYIDELVFAIVLGMYIVKVLEKGKLCFSSEYRGLVIPMSLYVLISLMGNVIYRYQTPSLVMVDLITNVKFYFSFAFINVVSNCNPLHLKKPVQLAKYISVFLLALFVLDFIFKIFPSDYRYGIRYTQLYFGHPTYLAGCCVFLIALLSFYGVKKNFKYILIYLLLMIATLRGKAIAGALGFLILYYVIVIKHSKLKVWQIVVIGIIGVAAAWSQIYFYFFSLSGVSARSVMMKTSFDVMRDYFPIGTGFGTYGSHAASVNYSPVYVKYGFRLVTELSGEGHAGFFDDHFWPIVFGQSGVLGTICYLLGLSFIFRKVQKCRKIDTNLYISCMFIIIYLLISSTSEPAFNNSIAVPMGVVLGMAFRTQKIKSILLS